MTPKTDDIILGQQSHNSAVGGTESDKIKDLTREGLSGMYQNDSADGGFMRLDGMIMHASIIDRFNSVTQTVYLAKIRDMINKQHPEAILFAPTFQEYCRIKKIGYKSIMERIANLNELGFELMQTLEQIGLKRTDIRALKRLDGYRREQLEQRILSGEIVDREDVRQLIHDQMQDIETLRKTADENKLALIEENDELNRRLDVAEEQMDQLRRDREVVGRQVQLLREKLRMEPEKIIPEAKQHYLSLRATIVTLQQDPAHHDMLREIADDIRDLVSRI